MMLLGIFRMLLPVGSPFSEDPSWPQQGGEILGLNSSPGCGDNPLRPSTRTGGLSTVGRCSERLFWRTCFAFLLSVFICLWLLPPLLSATLPLVGDVKDMRVAMKTSKMAHALVSPICTVHSEDKPVHQVRETQWWTGPAPPSRGSRGGGCR